MLCDAFRKAFVLIKIKTNIKAIGIILFLSVMYIMNLQKWYMRLFETSSMGNVTGLIIFIFQHKYFLSFMIPLLIIYQISKTHNCRFVEIIKFGSRKKMIISIIISNIVTCIAYLLFLLLTIIIVAAVTGTSFSNCATLNEQLAGVIPHIAESGNDLNLISFTIKSIVNVFFYMFSIGMLYMFLYCIVKRRSTAIFLEIVIIFVTLALVKTFILSLFLHTFMGHLMYDIQIDWGYWVTINLAMLIAIFTLGNMMEYDYGKH